MSIVFLELKYKIERYNDNQNAMTEWSKKTWYIYHLDNFFIQYEIRDGYDKVISSDAYRISYDDMDKIKQYIELVKTIDKHVDTLNSDTWKFTECVSNYIVWVRKSGYINGIVPLEEICKMLTSIVNDNSNKIEKAPEHEIKGESYNKYDYYLEKIKDEVNSQLIEKGLLKFQDGKQISLIGCSQERHKIEKKLLKEKYNIDMDAPEEPASQVIY